MKILINDISVDPGRREAQQERVEKLVKSMGELGLLNPITIDKKHTLIAGLHRLEAAKLLGWVEIECTVSSLEGIHAEMAEIDENIVRNNLTGRELGKLLLRRKKLYELLYPETKRGGDRKSSKIKARNSHFDPVLSFAEDTSKTLNMSKRTVQERIQTAKNLTPEAERILDGMDKEVSNSTALKISRLKPEQQTEAAGLLASKKIRSIAEYHPAQQEEPAGQGAADGKPQEEADDTEPDVHTPPAGETIRGSALFREIVADLKNADKDFSCTPDSFLAEIASFVQNFQKELDWYNMPYYEAVFPALTPEQFRDFRRQMDTICTAVQNLIHHVEVNVK